MLAELTHRCPLHCPYCSNPLELLGRDSELSTKQWISVLDQARELGVLQVHFSGGEPLARKDLPELVAHASGLGQYVNLVTSGLGLTEERLSDLAGRGLNHVQLSVQDAEPESANLLAGTRAHAHKITAARLVNAAGLPLTVNVVLHRGNIDRIGAIIDFAEELGAQRLELANTQYYGWALRNRDALLPSRAQLDAAALVVREASERLSERLDLIYVLADYYADRPKPCMYGWGSRQFTVAPDGDVLPCPAATAITDLRMDNVTTTALADIWYRSDSFNAFRGQEWMREPCRSCDRREIDFGGCRCQAFLFTGDATSTDPVCGLSPDRHLIDAILEADAVAPAFVMRKAAP
ncbi:coenzyme PQQ biosynthesis protein E [Stackebrandtia nassauensis DSM 44728]|uniref:PqqA peptide cyclase n=1 Tax=Stackebrandtia nassauensis (strain DSM 44728 / CIP 108903 / NRRL B-16338 / NBRC 102104 / LLR-40K-21) TaxID=446470 RepID=D3Q200_STANL|nr:coenzyme PQQ biosynthesis protein E [Stackebrandtia nassauensis DSM 44728]